ncbi:MAG: DUF6817 domain-containing protein [Planctomycetia bacterium]
MEAVTTATGRALEFLKSRNAAEIPHLDGRLLPHLQGTYDLLSEWKAPDAVRLAGLMHTTYSTPGFPIFFAELNRREDVETVIGAEAERHLYFYASCDRTYLYPLLERLMRVRRKRSFLARCLESAFRRRSSVPSFKSRFDGGVVQPDLKTFASFLELSFANELEILRRMTPLSDGLRRSWRDRFGGCRDFVSPAAWNEFERVVA